MVIKKIREQALLTQKEFANELNVSLGIVKYWEQNNKEPNLRYKRRVVEFCKKNNIDMGE